LPLDVPSAESNTDVMLRLSAQSKFLLTLVCIVVVAMRLSGAHLHLCFDGSEPPAAMHFDSDAGLHHLDEEQHAADAAHSDMDVNLIADALIKKSDSGFDVLTVITAFALLMGFLPFVLRLVPQVELLLPINAHRAHLRPLVRGPPR
jgi:hypothetical protein